MVAGMIVATPLPPFFLETDFQNEGGRDSDLNFEPISLIEIPYFLSILENREGFRELVQTINQDKEERLTQD